MADPGVSILLSPAKTFLLDKKGIINQTALSGMAKHIS
jgi:hypothetical protein